MVTKKLTQHVTLEPLNDHHQNLGESLVPFVLEALTLQNPSRH